MWCWGGDQLPVARPTPSKVFNTHITHTRTLLRTHSYNADDPVLDMDGSLFASGADDRLELSVASPLRPGRQIVSVTVGTTGHPSCSFPGNGFARTHQTAPKCVDRFTGTFALQTLVAFCGIRVEEALSPPIVSRAKSRAVGVLGMHLFSCACACTACTLVLVCGARLGLCIFRHRKGFSLSHVGHNVKSPAFINYPLASPLCLT